MGFNLLRMDEKVIRYKKNACVGRPSFDYSVWMVVLIWLNFFGCFCLVARYC